MALFGSVSSKQVDEFAKSLAQELAKRYPAALDKGGERRISQKRMTTILEDTCNRALDFKKQHKLGVYKKARLGNTFSLGVAGNGLQRKFRRTRDRRPDRLHHAAVARRRAEEGPQPRLGI